ncbi:UNVERIFIED_CONTAM: hypothetical protein HDU68_011335 [Siphonaria sp. JEL0065]|nr:hypothetical protein HDU68_011335 [Siphonaria sp. JEL0065]
MSSLPVPKRRPSIATNLHSAHHQQQLQPSHSSNVSPTSNSSSTTAKIPSPAPSTAAPPSIAPSMKRQKSYARNTSSGSNSRRQSSEEQSQPLPEWNSSKVINTKQPSIAIARSKSYAASLKKGKSGNVLESTFDGSSVTNKGEWLNGQQKSTRALQGRVFELEGLLEIALQDLEAANNAVEDQGALHRCELDALKMEMSRMKEEMEAESIAQVESLGVEIKVLKAEKDVLMVKAEMQMKEIGKLHKQGVLAGETVTSREVELSALKAEYEGLNRKVAVLQQEIERLQEQSLTTAQDGMALEVEMESAVKTIESLNQRIAIEKADHERQVQLLKSNLETEFHQMETKLSDMKALEIRNSTEIFSLKWSLAAARDETAKVSETLATLETHHSEAVSCLSEKENSIADHISHISSLTQQLEQFVDNKNQLEVMLMERNTQVDALREQLFDLTSFHEKSIASLKSTTESEISENNTVIESLKNDLILMTKNEQESASKVNGLTLSLESCQNDLKLTQQALETKSLEHQSAIEALSHGYAESLSEKNNAIAKLMIDLDSLSKSLEESQKTESKLSLSLESSQKETAVAQATIAEYKSCVDTFTKTSTQSIAEKETVIAKLMLDSDSLTKKLQESKENESKLSNALESTLEDVQVAKNSVSEYQTVIETMKLASLSSASEKDATIAKLTQESVSLSKLLSVSEAKAAEASSSLAEAIKSLEISQQTAVTKAADYEVAIESITASTSFSLTEKDNSIAQLTETLEALKTNLQETTTQKSELQSLLTKATYNFDRVKIDSSKKASEYEAIISVLNEQSLAQKTENQLRGQESKRLNETIQALQAQIASINGLHKEAVESLQLKIAVELKEKEDELKSSGTFVETLKSKIIELEAEKRRLEGVANESENQSKLANIRIAEYEATITKLKDESKYTIKRLEIVEKNLELMNARNTRRVHDSRFKSSESGPGSGRNSVVTRSPEPTGSHRSSIVDIRDIPPTPSTISSLQRSAGAISSTRGSFSETIGGGSSRPTSVVERAETPLDSIASALDSAFGL